MDVDYKVLRSLSSNVVVSKKDNNEYGLLGKGTGFGKRLVNLLQKGVPVRCVTD
ncbi:hypothetical protein K9O30_11435 [Clostridium bowmanii]|uniref:CAT RNA binding domain-containing protein n=1 Tax=Clostridium bowmanii TaxID=132925 RepID=UPI001C0CD7DF|nr:CAT RNA binding domain-containing protein [Clostridium bowmanii]MBU3189839.1 hypothetical protein [Clostridium bowmanii]MCA1074323.1 hypothetical protein [Clostridium bowmanii]